MATKQRNISRAVANNERATQDAELLALFQLAVIAREKQWDYERSIELALGHDIANFDELIDIFAIAGAAGMGKESVKSLREHAENNLEVRGVAIPRYRIVHESTSGPFGPHDGDTRTIKYVSGGKDYAGRVVSQKFAGDVKSGGWVDID